MLITKTPISERQCARFYIFKKSCCCKVCRKRAIFAGAPNLTMKENCGLGESKPC